MNLFFDNYLMAINGNDSGKGHNFWVSLAPMNYHVRDNFGLPNDVNFPVTSYGDYPSMNWR